MLGNGWVVEDVGRGERDGVGNDIQPGKAS